MKKKATKPCDVMYANWVLKSLMSRDSSAADLNHNE
jgi:hypothetical protein